MKYVKLSVFIVAVGVIMAILAACGGKEAPAGKDQSATAANVNPPGVFPIVKEPITINVGIVQSATVENYETNALTKWYEEKGNFKLQFEILPARDAQQKLEVMVASGGELPEAIIGLNMADEAILNIGLEGAAIPLNDYYDKWGFYLKEGFEKVANKDLKKWITSADGNIYYISKNNEQIGNMYAFRSWINKKWLDNLGLPIPKTTDEFRLTLEAFVNNDPNRNGVKDEIGMIGGTGWRAQAAEWLLNAFVYNDTTNRFVTAADGKIEPVFNKTEWRQGLRYVNGLVKAGLFLPQNFTMDDNQMRQLTENGAAAQVGVITHGNFASVFGATNSRKLEYVPLPPLTGPDGVSYATFYPDIPQKMFFITKSAKNPEAIFRWGDLMWSEEAWMRTRFGVPGIDWKPAGPDDKSPLDSLGIKARMIPILPWGSVQNSHWSFQNAGVVPYGYSDGQVFPEGDPLYGERWISAAVPFYVNKEAPNRVDVVKLTLEETEEIKDIKNTINSYVNESLALFTVGDKDIERDWDGYVRELEAMNLKRYLELSQSGYDRAVGKK